MISRTHTVMGLCLALGACQTPVPANTTDSSPNPTDGAIADASADVTAPTALRYTPMGCTYMVHTEQGTTGNAQGDRTTFGSAPAPTNVHVTWAADPATTIAALWSTDPATLASVMQYGTSMTALDHTAVGHVSTGGSGATEVTVHEVHTCGLSPDTTYYYRVGGEGHWSATQSFKTAPAPGRTDYDVNFAVSGDSRDNFAVWRMVQERMLSVSAMRQPDFEVFSGDAVLLGTIQGAWQQWFDGAAPTQAHMPFVLAHGNHDNLALNYLMQFAQPQADTEDQSELYFSFDYGPIHFTFLNDSARDMAGSLAGTQLTWLRADLTHARDNRSRVPFIVVVHHKPPFASSIHSSDADTEFVRRTWPPVYNEFGVDLVLNGHEHDFEVSKELDGMGNEVSGRPGTVYITAAGAGAELYMASMRSWSHYSESVVNFLLVHATNHSLEVTPYRGDGTVISQGRVTRTPRM